MTTFEMPDFYLPPFGLPLNWRDEQSGVLVRAVPAYIHDNCTQEDVELVIAYCRYYILAPSWDMAVEGHHDGQEQLRLARLFARDMTFKQDIMQFVEKCLHMGLDPL